MNESDCPRCAGALIRDAVGDVSCFICGWVRWPERSAEEIAALTDFRKSPRRVTRHAGQLL